MAQVVLADRARDALFELLSESVDDPAKFIRAVLDPRNPDGTPAELREWQSEICERIRERLAKGNRHVKVLLRTCHGAGKTFLAGALLLWFICTRPYSRGLTTAPTWAQIEGPLWREIGKLYNGSLLRHLGFARLLNTRFDVTDTWYAVGASSDKPENLEGQQSNVASVRLVDEAKAVPKEVFDATEGLLGAPETLDLWFSTPSIQDGEFFKRDTGNDASVIRVVVTIDDLIAEGVPGKENWKAGRLAEWGVDSAEYRSRAMAEYIDNAEGALYPVSWVERAMNAAWQVSGPVVAGMDVAGSIDGDQNALALVQGPDPSSEKFRVLSVAAWHERDTMLSKGKALTIARPHKAKITVDVTGLGQGVADSLREMAYPAGDYRSANKARDPERFINRKAEDSWALREALERETVALPDSQALKSQLAAVRYQITQAGKIKVIDPKDSPDLVDAVLIAVSSAGRGEFQAALADTSLGEREREWKRSSW